jgi:NAD(P)-dependent dehydrogenase (short-subunit alcohol dehydrogenase family)
MKNALVTGAAKRLGRAIALDLAAHGWNVAIHYNSSEADADIAAQAARAFGVEAATLKCDLSKEVETAQLVDRAAKEIGPLTALINSASLFENDDWQSATRRPICARPCCCRSCSPNSCWKKSKATSSISLTSGC